MQENTVFAGFYYVSDRALMPLGGNREQIPALQPFLVTEVQNSYFTVLAQRSYGKLAFYSAALILEHEKFVFELKNFANTVRTINKCSAMHLHNNTDNNGKLCSPLVQWRTATNNLGDFKSLTFRVLNVFGYSSLTDLVETGGYTVSQQLENYLNA